MELVANVWPVVDEASGIVQRFFMRAYAMADTDDVILATLKALAPTDFYIASVFSVPKRFTLVSEFGSISGAVEIGAFHQSKDAILEPAFRQLEEKFAILQGLAIDDPEQEPRSVIIVPRFPPDPYLLVTSILELENGQLVPRVHKNGGTF